MLDRDDTSTAQFAAAFPTRFADVMAEAQGAMAGILASAGNGSGLIPPEALHRLHEIYRLRVELEIETANVLWRTAEVVCALTDAIEALNRRARPAPLPPQRWLGGVARGIVERRSSRIAMKDDSERRDSRWPDLGGPLTSVPPEGQPMTSPDFDDDGLRPAWARDRGAEAA
jgi:hypothetical protein